MSQLYDASGNPISTTNPLPVQPYVTNSFVNIPTATTTAVKASAGVLHAIIINKAVASGIITIYDSLAASGTKIGTITFPATLLNDAPYSLLYDLAFATGLTIVTSAATDLTVVYR